MMGLSVRKKFSVPQPAFYLTHSRGPAVVLVGTGMGTHKFVFLSPTKAAKLKDARTENPINRTKIQSGVLTNFLQFYHKISFTLLSPIKRSFSLYRIAIQYEPFLVVGQGGRASFYSNTSKNSICTYVIFYFQQFISMPYDNIAMYERINNTLSCKKKFKV
jgi:hypothetical protein